MRPLLQFVGHFEELHDRTTAGLYNARCTGTRQPPHSSSAFRSSSSSSSSAAAAAVESPPQPAQWHFLRDVASLSLGLTAGAFSRPSAFALTRSGQQTVSPLHFSIADEISHLTSVWLMSKH